MDHSDSVVVNVIRRVLLDAVNFIFTYHAAGVTHTHTNTHTLKHFGQSLNHALLTIGTPSNALAGPPH